ncbi:MAG TPA: dihydrodipicolinate synthase family protein [Bryobacteraceae bacterium]|jgi:4-hydroxy-tetrahydrodipicolinate synthase|nr:dihydrodipicolinate synthase family protein [Bryobacteraceae bacterium]
MSQPRRRLHGVISALLLPRDAAGLPAWDAFDANTAYAMQAGLAGVCVNGATGEYAAATRSERREATAHARRAAGDSAIVLSGIGAVHWTETRSLAREAADAGADALLIPAPHFFCYEQSDLEESFTRIAADSPIPVILYNLPAFTGALTLPLVESVLRSADSIVGIKDSSGELAILEALSKEPALNAVRAIGNDAALSEALDRKLCDCVISGVAGVLPELTLSLWNASRAGDTQWKEILAHRLSELLSQLNVFPTPWGLKLIAELRFGVSAQFSLPVSQQRKRQMDDFRTWFRQWWPQTEANVNHV